MLSKVFITKLILYYAAINGLNGQVALSVAKNESSLRPNAIGKAKEVGIYQLKSQYVKGYTREQLFDPIINIKVGIYKLLDAKRTCKHQVKNTWLLCFNRGSSGAIKVKYPEQDRYVLRTEKIIASLK